MDNIEISGDTLLFSLLVVLEVMLISQVVFSAQGKYWELMTICLLGAVAIPSIILANLYFSKPINGAGKIKRR